VNPRWRAVRQVLAGDPGDFPRKEVSAAARRLIVLAIVTANLGGAAIVMTLLLVVLPIPEEAEAHDPAGVWVTLAYVAIAVVVGTIRGLRLAKPVIVVFEHARDPTEAERAAVLRLPVTLTFMQAALWGVAVVLFGCLSLTVSGVFAFEVAITVALGGLATAAVSYLQTQRLLRGAIDSALAAAPPRRREVPGVGVRVLLTWALTTAVPVAGAMSLAIFALVTDEVVTVDELARSIVVLCAVALWVGLLAMVVFSRSLGDPLRRLRDAFADVEAGDLETQVRVFDATEVGYAAASFNRMVGGLREREKLRDLFGRQVGEDVARRALEEGVTLGGEEREAAVLFVDIIGSTAFASDRPPTEVVEALNGFFATVVDVTQEHGGLVNKFEGDAALCVFGAPLDAQDPAGKALAAGRAMCEKLREGELDAAIGISAGTVVAGNVGTPDRYEYTVIGDPVNEAARLTELAKEREGRLLASGAAVERASDDEAGHWELGEEVELRGRKRPTRLAEARPARS
jgi:adenylate cyclase